jgi:hypothetical protein
MAETKSRTFAFLPLTVRLETLGNVATPLVLRGTPLPTKRSETFSTASDNQPSVELSLFLGESPLSRNDLPFGKFHLPGIPPEPKGTPQILVEFSVTNDCTVTACASLKGSESKVQQVFPPPADLSDTFIAKMLADAESSQAADDSEIRRIEAVNQANSLIKKAEERLAAGSDSKLSEAVAALGLALASGDSDQIRDKCDLLSSKLTPNFDDIFSNYGNIFGTPAPARPSTRSQKQKSPAAKEGITSTASTQALGKIFGGGTFTLDPQLCFVLMPFDKKFQPLYDDQVRPSVEAAGLRCERADDIRGTNVITWDIWEKINRARFLIAELTDRNPNVFYELGLAHALSKDVILITQSMEFVPFDLKSLRCIPYEFTPRGVQTLEKAIRGTIAALMKIG